MTADRAKRIQQTRRSRKTNKTRRDATGLLSALGIMYCGYCGKTVKNWNNSKIRLDGTRLDYYACVTKNKKNACPASKMINHQTVNQKVLKNLFFTLTNGDRLREWWFESRRAINHSGKAAEIITSIKREELKKKNLVNAIAEGLIDFSDAKEQMKNIKFAIFELQDKLEFLTNTIAEEPDWDALKITHEKFETLSFSEQREVIRNAIESITLNNTYAISKYTFPRSESGSYEEKINLTRGNQKRPRLVKRTRTQPPNITSYL